MRPGPANAVGPRRVGGGHAEQYDEMINRMSVADVSLPGDLFHVAGPSENGWRIFDVWESPEVLERFTREILMPILEETGFPFPQIWTWPVYKTLSPQTEEVRASRLRIIAVQNAKHRRLARDLHDGAQQNLIALKIKLGLAAALAGQDPAKDEHLLHELATDADRTIESLRELARGLYPSLLADGGLLVALEAKARKSPTPVEIDAPQIGRYPEEIEAAVYFVCLEALQNAAKHSQASRVRLRLSERAGALEVQIEDDGVGFDPATQRRGSGLQNISDRFEAMGGSLEIRSVPGQGTSLIGRIPQSRQGILTPDTAYDLSPSEHEFGDQDGQATKPR